MAEKASGFFSKIKRGLFMTHTEILEKIEGAVREKLGYDESVLESLEEALIAADVGAETAGTLVAGVAARARRYRPDDLPKLRVLLKEEIDALLSTAPKEQVPPGRPEVVFIVGVNGTGKTTTAAKRAARDIAEGKKVILAAADTFRAAAIEQLQTWGDRVGAPVVRHSEGSDPAAVVHDAIAAARARDADVLYVDTAGRLHTKFNLMEELAKMRRVAGREIAGAPHRSLLVLDATTGGNGLVQAKKFVDAAGVTGVVLTKLDGTAKGGVVLAILRELGIPVVAVGVGEGKDDLVPFDARDFAAALLG
ncbi:MAG TPA: signal recognition particle-docking protein FtsY [Thermoanaerobaculia bacterium]|nr:signal recognition particle-docking protein FtsY [Thermoanaerobaculia bacterium]